MNLLIAQEKQGLKHVSQGDWREERLPYPIWKPALPCAGHTLMAVGSLLEQECLCFRKRDGALVSRMPAAPGLCGLCLSPCGRYLYQLSSEADCVHTRLTLSGDLLYAAPAGVFPRTMRLRAEGKRLIVAGGAVPEAYVFSAPELLCQRVISTRHPCFAADEYAEGMVLVCAAEGCDIQTVVYTLKDRTIRPRRILELPGQPGGMCVCPDGWHMLLSTPDGLMKIDLRHGEILWNRPEWPLCMQLCCQGDQALVGDTLDGNAYLISHIHPWKRRVVGYGGNAQACFVEINNGMNFMTAAHPV